MQANPDVWDVWSWWEDETDDLDSWTIARHIDDVRAGDNFALWISGAKAGVYAVGHIDSSPTGPLRPSGGYWIEPPKHDVWGIDLRPTKYLFDTPILKDLLRQDPDFASALILRMPGGANPIPLEPAEWNAITQSIGRRGQGARPKRTMPVVTARPLGEVPEDITVPTKAQEQRRSFREARLVKRYEKSLGRPLTCRSIRLPTGERLVCDAYDAITNTLVEAKSSASRQDVRTAIGQLFDYRRHLDKRARLAVLLPTRPSDDVLDLLKSLTIDVVIEDGRQFTSA
ncbi:hypothetical protein [Janibacter sp. DB-40]|uniref:hypothetical protein n=1 Tax=Janibacter sp. DB-40 TaxID=3028808 RepID=UPI002406E0F1|nr:hypothetical protein [Janibacter sp. DB-40]